MSWDRSSRRVSRRLGRQSSSRRRESSPPDPLSHRERGNGGAGEGKRSECRTRNLQQRIVFATNADLEDLVESNQFRSDLYYRMGCPPIGMGLKNYIALGELPDVIR